jgi:FOG: TPR repeat, SEL1 subfamily
MRKSYIIGGTILLVLIGGFVFHRYVYSKIEYKKGLSYYKNKNYQKALPLFKDAANQGYAPAEAKLGEMYLNGEGTLKNYDKAMYWSKKAADQGDAEGEFDLAKIYHDGLGVPRNYRKALYWVKKSA